MKLFKKKDSDKFKEFVVKCNGKNGTVIRIVRADYIIRFENGICETHKQSECENYRRYKYARYYNVHK